MITTASSRPTALPTPAAPERLRRELTRIMGIHRPGVGVTAIRRSPIPAHSSWAVERLCLSMSDGSTERLVWKDLTREAPGSRAGSIKPGRISEPRREPWVYASVLSGIQEGPTLRGRSHDGREEVHWIFLEDVEGEPLWQAVERDAWRNAATWLGRFHARFMGEPPRSPLLLDQDVRLHRWWLTRARALASGEAGGRPLDVRRHALRRIAPAHRVALHRVLAEPPTFLHGEFYPANILVAAADASRAIVPVDWEMAGTGPAVLDLAALTSGGWSDSDRAELVAAYSDARSQAGAPCLPFEQLLASVDAARLLLAVQWLGWAGHTWCPPSDLATNWLEEAVRAADRLSAP